MHFNRKNRSFRGEFAVRATGARIRAGTHILILEQNM